MQSTSKKVKVAADGLTIDHSEQFPTLDDDPIVEAVLQWQASGTKQLSEQELHQALSSSFREYAIAPQHDVQAAFEGSPEGVQARSTRQGFRLTKLNGDRPEFVCQFKRDGIIFSRLAPYENWQQFAPEALRFWTKFRELFDPQCVSRLSVRFISEVFVDSIADIAELIDITTEPMKSLGLSSSSFFHQDTVKAGGLPYTIHVRRAAQPASESESTQLIVDIDVTTDTEHIEMVEVEEKLSDLRFLKNKVFFGVMKDAVRSFGTKQS